jgi:formylglycine-generating enzyme required for sulfatase activity
MLRGGSHSSHPIALRSANRIRNKPDYKNNSIGFRIVRSGPRPE